MNLDSTSQDMVQAEPYSTLGIVLSNEKKSFEK